MPLSLVSNKICKSSSDNVYWIKKRRWNPFVLKGKLKNIHYSYLAINFPWTEGAWRILLTQFDCHLTVKKLDIFVNFSFSHLIDDSGWFSSEVWFYLSSQDQLLLYSIKLHGVLKLRDVLTFQKIVVATLQPDLICIFFISCMEESKNQTKMILKI